MTKIILLALLVSSSLYAQEETAPTPEVVSETVSTEDLLADPVADEALEAKAVVPADATAETVAPEAAPADAVAVPVPAEEPTPEITETASEATPVAENPNVEPAPVVEAAPAEPVAPIAQTPVLTTEVDDDEKFNPRKSHWITSFGFEGLKYPVYWDFAGNQKNLREGDMELWGGRLGFGGELHLGAGIHTATRVEGFFVGTLFNKVLNGGDEDSDVEFAFTKKTGQMYGAEVSQTLSFLFDFKTRNPFMDEWSYLSVEPFIEAGIGTARASTRVNYKYDLDFTEAYRLKVDDTLATAKLAAGINFISTSGYFLYLKATQTRIDVTDRKTKQLIRQSGDASDTVTEPELDDKIDPITVYAIGGGYKF